MGLYWVFKAVGILAMAAMLFWMLCKIVLSFWIWPNKAYKKLKMNGINGPPPTFPMGNINDMVAISKKNKLSPVSSDLTTHDNYSTVFPSFALWQKSYGKVFVYWLGTEPFLYVSDAEFLKQMNAAVPGKNWGKSQLFKNDRDAMFGDGIVMAEGEDWVRHRNVLTPAFFVPNLKGLASFMVTSTNNMIDRWTSIIKSGQQEIDIEKEIILTTGEIIAKVSFGMTYENGRKVLEGLRALQQTLFSSNRYVGVPFSKYLCLKQNRDAKRLGDEIDALLLSVINDITKSKKVGDHTSVAADNEKTLLNMALDDDESLKLLTTKEMVDECKTLFFGGYETTALALTWTLFLLAMHPEWQNQLREEIKKVVGDQVVDANIVAELEKMEWVMNEALRLYPPAPNLQRQARDDIEVNGVIIPKETNILIDVMAIMHDRGFWGDTVHQFRPERFEADILYGGCKSKMGYVPFGFGGRMCIGRNLAIMEYKILLTLLLTRFSFSLSPYYTHSPAFILSLRPAKGMPLIVQPLY